MLSVLRPLDATLRLQRLLYEFKEPFDKQRARSDWKYSGIALLTKDSLLFYYLQLFTLFLEILTTIFD